LQEIENLKERDISKGLEKLKQAELLKEIEIFKEIQEIKRIRIKGIRILLKYPSFSFSWIFCIFLSSTFRFDLLY
jgi:hypothetical protein